MRALHPRLYFPGLTDQPLWDSGLFPLASRLASCFELIRAEAAGLLARLWAFSRPPGVFTLGRGTSSSLRGIWMAYYLRRHFQLQRVAAEQAPVSLRCNDDPATTREAMLAFLGPNSEINWHSDQVNFILTVYLPLISPFGSWIRFADQTQWWVDSQCFVADSTYYHRSTNHSTQWRAVMIVDVWHPELTPIERVVLAQVVPQLDAILRGEWREA
jgi:hypothetical protein